jgi:putative restriction endonuclease
MPHQNESALRWFQTHAGQTVTWEDLQNGPGLLVSPAKGIYKPQGQEYALSVRQTLGSPYADEEPEYQDDGSWTYRYAQEGFDSDPEHLFSNRGLMACMRDTVPVGVLRQLTKKPDVTRYQVLGLAHVVDWENKIFTLRSTLFEYDVQAYTQELLIALPSALPYGFDPALVTDARERMLKEVVRRKGQPAFRSGLLTAYQGRCAITGCEVEPVLEAAHITPYLGPETNRVANGLLLRGDVHTLWDSGLIYLDRDYKVELKPSLLSSDYARLKGQTILLPIRREIQPSELAIIAHRDWCLSNK